MPGAVFQIGSVDVNLYATWVVTPPVVDPSAKIVITITTENGGDVTLSKAPLLYNKQHVITMDIDDGLNDMYMTLLPLFTGGIPEYDSSISNGLFSTDGCGNDVSYKGNTLTWVVSSNTGADWFEWSDGSHWLNYAQLDTLVANGFGIVDHGYYTDMTMAFVNPVTAVDNFINWSESRYGFRPLYAASPGGQVFDTTAWKNRWFEKGLRFIVLGSGAASALTRVDNINVATLQGLCKLAGIT